jgi:Ca2+-binding RTX toxin-like protein
LQGGGGADRLYADSKVTIAQAISSGNSQSGSGQKGDWLTGNAGDDILIGAADNDALSGGSGADLLIGGAGDDDILGDVDWAPTSLNWTTVDNLGTHQFQPVSGVAHPVDYGADVIYAGAGNDFGWGGRGDDTLYGEAGDDYLAGNGDNDALFGGDGVCWGTGRGGTDMKRFSGQRKSGEFGKFDLPGLIANVERASGDRRAA